MPNILLTGAGFSANWGAPVAAGFFTALLADSEVQKNERVRSLLWRNQKNFEDALAQLQRSSGQESQAYGDFLVIQGAMGRVFDRLNTIFKRQDFELLHQDLTLDRKKTVGEFLSKFDAIFTLNQDLLLEIHYFDKRRALSSAREWSSNSLPGMQAGRPTDSNAPWSSCIWTAGGDFVIPTGCQPYFKLHGSTNWRDAKNSEIMILGGGKHSAIQATPLLQQYQQMFAQYLKKPGARLTVIGYSFRDEHINSAMKEAIENVGLKMYVIDPQGAALAYNARPLKEHNVGNGPTDFDEWFQKGLHSASTISLRLLLRDESLDREVLHDFLAGR